MRAGALEANVGAFFGEGVNQERRSAKSSLLLSNRFTVLPVLLARRVRAVRALGTGASSFGDATLGRGGCRVKMGHKEKKSRGASL